MAARRRNTVARHGELSSPRPSRSMLTIVGVLVAIVAVSGLSVSAFALWDSTATLQRTAVTLERDAPLPPTIGEIEGGVNLLLVGTDSCEGQDLRLFPRCGIDDDGLERNDVTMLVNISDEPRRVTVVSFPRDMLVEIPSCPAEDGGRYSAMTQMPINASYGYGGLACTALTVSNLAGMNIDFAGAIRWTGVIHMSDALGGVEVCVAGDISDRHTGLQLTAGTHTLQGEQALQFLRIRHGIGDGSDLARISNQQQFMSSLMRKLQDDDTLRDPTTLFSLATTAMQQINSGQLVLDEGLADPTRMVQIAMALKDVPMDDIVFVQYPTSYAPSGNPDNNLVLPLTETAEAVFAAIRANEPIELTGEASQGDGVVVQGEDATGTTSPEPTPDPSTSATGGSAPGPTETAVALPSTVAGTTAEQVTCTVPEG